MRPSPSHYRPDRNPLDEVFGPDLRLSEKGHRYAAALSKRVLDSGCKACSLHEERQGNPPVPGEGRGRIFMVGHRIGSNEADSGQPAMGPASQFGFKLFLEALLGSSKGLTLRQCREAVLDYAWITNAARCGAHRDVSVTPGKRRVCSSTWMQQEIAALDPAFMLFWGKKAANTVLQQTPPPKGEVRYMSSPFFRETLPVMWMEHPVNVAGTGQLAGVVKSRFQRVHSWLWENGLAEKPPLKSSGGEVTHHLITDQDGLDRVWEDLKGKRHTALDTETGFFGDLRNMSVRERDKGALLTRHEKFEMVTAQVAGLSSLIEDDGEDRVSDTYTICCGMRDRYGRMQQELTVEDVAGFLDELYRFEPGAWMSGEDGARQVYTWNQSFDGPVVTRSGCDTLGIGDPSLPIEIKDGLFYLSQVAEELGPQKGTTSLDAAAQRHLSESKGSFGEHFEDPSLFPYTDLSDPETREHFLEYCGQDPRLTALCARASIRELEDEAIERTSRTQVVVPRIGLMPYEEVGLGRTLFDGTYSRFTDVTLPIDHQTIPVLSEMETVGFDFQTEEADRAARYAQKMQRRLKRRLEERYQWYNPFSNEDVKRAARESLQEIGSRIWTYLQSGGAVSPQKMLASFEGSTPDPQDMPERGWEDAVVRAYEEGYGEIDAKKKTIQDKVLLFLRIAYRMAEHELSEAGEDPEEAGLTEDYAGEIEGFFDAAYAAKQINKRNQTYYQRFLELTGRAGILHPSFWNDRVSSGRLSSDFQNIPTGADDDELTEAILKGIRDEDLPEDPEKRELYLAEHMAPLDVREACEPTGPGKLNRIFETMRFRSPPEENGTDGYVTWNVRTDLRQVLCTADYAQMEDRMAYAQTGDEEKERILSNPELDAHFWNVAYCFGPAHGFDTSTEEGMWAAYNHFTAEENKAKYKTMYRSPMKNVHYASLYGAGVKKLHTMLVPIFKKQGTVWLLEDTEDLKAKYDQLYAGVTQFREDKMAELESIGYLEYPLFGRLRRASSWLGEMQDPLSVINAFNQGTCAYLTKLAMLRMRTLIWMNSRRWNTVHTGGDVYVGVNLQVHDEIAVSHPEPLGYEVALALESAMKMIVGPPEGDLEPSWDSETEGYRQDSGYLFLPDPAFEGKVLLDADAEIKATIAKKKVLSSGEPNLLGHLASEEARADLEAKGEGFINKDYPLVLCKDGHIDYLM